MIVDGINVRITKLKLKPGDQLFVSAQMPLSPSQMEKLTEAFKRQVPAGVGVIVTSRLNVKVKKAG